MSQQDNFFSGFLVGTVVGGVVGGILGTIVTSRLHRAEQTNDEFASLNDRPGKKRRSVTTPNEQTIEAARRGLEDKIAQLNEAIDDARQQLSNVNGVMDDAPEDAIAPEQPYS
jgi:hypothetical protein